MRRLLSRAAGTLALSVRRTTTLTVTRAAMLLLVTLLLTMTAQTAWAYNVTYIDENGDEKTVSAIVLNGGGATTLDAGLYVVTQDITYTGTVTLAHDVKIILMDGCTMNIGTSESRLSGKGFKYNNNESLTIYGQKNGTGALNVYTTGESNYAIWAGAITINGGTITADTDGKNNHAIYAQTVTINGGHVTAHTAGSGAYAIFSRNTAFTYNGGIVSATTEDTSSNPEHGYNAPAIVSYGNYTFNWRSATDRITIGTTGLSFDPNAPSGYETTATFSKPFSDGTTTYSGTLTGTELNALAGKTLQPAYTITYDLAGGSVATANPTTYTIESAAITLNSPTREGYSFAGWTGTGLDAATTTVTIAHGSSGDRSYTATWKKLLTNTDITVTIPSMEWTGSALTPTITVKDGETTLTETTDYTVSLPVGRTNSGDYTVTLTGAGNYDGTTTETFTITPKVLNDYGAINICQDQNGTTAFIDGSSEDAVSITSNVTVEHVTYNRTFTAGKCATVMLPFEYTCNGNEGGTFYEFAGVEQENSQWIATMRDAEDPVNKVTTLVANKPYLFMPSGTAMTFTGGATLNTTGGGGQQTADAGSNWTFKGTYAYREWITGGANSEEIGKAYGFAGVPKTDIEVGDFVRVASGAKIRPMGCYLLWSDTPNAAPARRMTRGAAADELPSRITVRLVGSNGETTAIGELDTKTGEISMDGWWTLDGIRLSGKPAKRGIYINNGRKIVVK